MLGCTLARRDPRAGAFAEEATIEKLTERRQRPQLHATQEIRSGEVRYVDISLTRVAYGSDRILQVICHDVTERERFAAHLRNEAEELERLVAERTRDSARLAGQARAAGKDGGARQAWSPASLTR